MFCQQQLDPSAQWLTRTKDAAQVLAWLGAALFFGYRAYSGYFITDLELKIECERKHQADTQHDLVSVCATIEKGERGAVALHDVRAWLCDHRDGHISGNPKRLTAVRRFALRTGEDRFEEADPSHFDKARPLLNLAPGDVMQFAGVFEVNRNEVAVVQVVVLTQRVLRLPFFGMKYINRYGQWLASRASLPE